MSKLNIFVQLLFAILFSFSNVIGADINIFVCAGIKGNDSNDGSENHPLKTIGAAKNKVQNVKPNPMTGNINVYLMGGTYKLTEPLKFIPTDGGQGQYSVNYLAYNSETPVISGGDTLNNSLWTRSNLGDNYWEYKLSPGTRLRELYADGIILKRATHSSQNGQEYYKINSVMPHPGTTISLESVPNGLSGGLIEEIIIYHDWNIIRALIKSVSSNVISCETYIMGPNDKPQTQTRVGNWVKFENVKTLLNENNEWYLNPNDGTLIYKGSIDNKTFIAPRTGQLIIVKGTSDIPVVNLNFIGIQFKYISWDFYHTKDKGFSSTQGDYYTVAEFNSNEPKYVIPPAVQYVYANNCNITKCVFSQIGNTALAFGAGSKYNSVYKCIFSCIGGSGVIIGMPDVKDYGNYFIHELVSIPQADWNSASKIPTGNSVTNCEIFDCSKQYFGSTGIWVQYAENTRIAYNKVYDLNCAGISIGYSFNRNVSSMKNTVVEGNEIFNVMKRMADYSAIYLNGNQNGAIVRKNYIHDIHRNEYATLNDGSQIAGIFLDQGCSNTLIKNNKIINVFDNLVNGVDSYVPYKYNLVKDVINGVVVSYYTPAESKIVFRNGSFINVLNDY